MGISFATETIAQVEAEIRGLLYTHWDEVALNKDEIKLSPDWEVYRAMEQIGALHILTVRSDKVLVGYYVSIVKGHLHYASSKTAVSDIFFIHKNYRHGRTAARLFLEHENAMRKLGVQRIITIHKVHLDISPLLAKLGYAHTENVFSKLLKD